MSTLSLLTVCIGLTCSIVEHNETYDVVEGEGLVNSMLIGIQSTRYRIRGYNKWFKMKSANGVTLLTDSITRELNEGLYEIEGYVKTSTGDKDEIDQCYKNALQDIKQAGQAKLSLLVPCINSFSDQVKVIKSSLSNHLKALDDIERQLLSIIPTCNDHEDRSTCLSDRTNGVLVEANTAENTASKFMDTTSKNYNTDYYDATMCQLPHLFKLQGDITAVKSRALTCILDA